MFCVHIDAKSNETYELMKKYANCVENVFVLDDRVDITYAAYSRLQADYRCMKELLKRSDKWDFLINLCGQDFPIKSNQEIVAELKTLTRSDISSNLIQPVRKPGGKFDRYMNR